MFQPTELTSVFRPDYTLTDFCALLHSAAPLRSRMEHKAQGVVDSRRCKEATYSKHQSIGKI